MNDWWKEHGYLAGRPIGGGLWIVAMPMIYTTRVAVADEWTVYDFYCYEDRALALRAYESWDGVSEPLPGYTRAHKGMVRP